MNSIAHILLGTTALERWAGTRRIGPRAIPQQWLIAGGIVVLLVLLALLIGISLRRQQRGRKPKVEEFGESATRRELNARERQILLAIALRGGLPHTQEIFRDLEAFNRGTVQLLAECVQTRTPQEVDALKAEVARLRLKLGFHKASGGGGPVSRGRLSSRDIPVGKLLELTGRRDQEAIVLQAEVLRNDESALAVTLPTPLESKPGDSWLARCYAGMSAWEFRTSTVSCNGQRLVLSHSDETHFINRRRFPRVAVHAPALVAHWPLLRSDPAAGAAVLPGTDASLLAGSAPQFVESTVTELAGPGLRIETPLQVLVDDRILVVFRLAEALEGAPLASQTVAAVGHVKRGRDLERQAAIPDAIDHVLEGPACRDFHALAAGPLSLAVELTGLSDEEIEELVSITNQLLSRPKHDRDHRAAEATEVSAYETTAR
jgi:hypothetical protein